MINGDYNYIRYNREKRCILTLQSLFIFFSDTPAITVNRIITFAKAIPKPMLSVSRDRESVHTVSYKFVQPSGNFILSFSLSALSHFSLTIIPPTFIHIYCDIGTSIGTAVLQSQIFQQHVRAQVTLLFFNSPTARQLEKFIHAAVEKRDGLNLIVC